KCLFRLPVQICGDYVHGNGSQRTAGNNRSRQRSRGARDRSHVDRARGEAPVSCSSKTDTGSRKVTGDEVVFEVAQLSVNPLSHCRRNQKHEKKKEKEYC